MNLSGHYAITPEALNNLFPLADQLQAATNKPTTAPAAFQIIDGAAIINVAGVIFPKANIFTLFGFGVAIDSLAEQLKAAESNPAVKKIIFSFDSPGGNIAGVNEFSNQINAATKPTAAYVSGTAASAAYWLAAACNEIVTDATAVLGSIGVIAVMRPPGSDTVEIVSTNANDKRPDPTTYSGKSTIRATLNEIEAVFHQSVSTHRPALTIDAMKSLRGGVRVGANAVSIGLADRVGSQTGVVYGQQDPISSQ
jgi:ClpP class serine protease